MFIVVGVSIALFASNLYYAQPLIITIAADLGLPVAWSGAVVSASQIGYGLGLLMLVPLADTVENKRLALACGFVTLVGITGIATSRSAGSFLFFAAMVGISSSGTQILVPYISHLVPEARRGRIIGMIMAGVLTSVMLARPFALFVAAAWGWRIVYYVSAAATLCATAGLWRMMPPRRPQQRLAYRETVLSMRQLFSNAPQVPRRTAYQAALFASFTMFWAVTPIVLAERFDLRYAQIGLFALVGAGGVLAAPLAGRWSDNGSTRMGTVLASFLIAISLGLSIWSVHIGMLLALIATAVVIDASIQMAQVLSRMVVLEVDSNIRGRVNALYMTIVYLSGAAGSIAGVSLYVRFGWTAVAAVGAVAGLAVLVCALVETPPPPADPRPGRGLPEDMGE